MSDIKFGEWCEMVRDGKIEYENRNEIWREVNVNDSQLLKIYDKVEWYNWRIKKEKLYMWAYKWQGRRIVLDRLYSSKEELQKYHKFSTDTVYRINIDMEQV